jgi:hypothetical protein
LSADFAKKLSVMLQEFVTEYYRVANVMAVPGFERLVPRVQLVDIRDFIYASFDRSNNTVTVNQNMFDVKDLKPFMAWFAGDKSVGALEELNENWFYRQYFKCFELNTMIHELEHSRRADEHTMAGAHYPQKIKFPWDGQPVTYSFDGAAVAVYAHVIAQGSFWSTLLEKYRKLLS